MRDIIENIGSAMTLCEYVMLNGKETKWCNVKDTLFNFSMEDTAIENIPESREEEFCYVSIRESLINIVNMFRLGGGYNYTDSGVVMLVRMFTKLYEQLMEIAVPDDNKEDDMMF